MTFDEKIIITKSKWSKNHKQTPSTIFIPQTSNIQKINISKIFQKKYSLQKYSSLNSIWNPTLIEQIGKEIFPDEDKAIFWTASETLLAVNKQTVHTISFVITLASRNIEFQSILIFHNDFPTFRLCHGRKVSFSNSENFVDKSFSFQEYSG